MKLCRTNAHIQAKSLSCTTDAGQAAKYSNYRLTNLTKILCYKNYFHKGHAVA
jgi:hypothetical protein